VLRLANQLAVFPRALEQYGQRAQTRSDHLRLVLRYLDWKPAPASGESLKELEQFLLERAMEHDTHATDTHGATLVNFGLFDLVGKALTHASATSARSPWCATTPRPRLSSAIRTSGRWWPTGGTRTWSRTATATCCGWAGR
jgi:hypothetical protein